MCYIRGDQLPVNVLKALRDGFTITHKGLLVWAPMPPAEEKPPIRLLFIALEAMFHFVFWSMASKTAKNHWGMKAMCPFDFEDLGYDGCNTHNPLYEQPFGDYDLSPEERKAHEEEMYERQLNHTRTRREKAKQEDPEAYREEIVVQARKWRAVNPEGAHRIIKRYEAKNLAEGKFHCAPCDYFCSRNPTLTRHKKSNAHRAAVRRVSHNH
jgi:hypothetical protein